MTQNTSTTVNHNLSPSDYIPEDTLSDYIPKDDFANHPENPFKKSEYDYIFKQRETNGFASAFVRVNARKFLLHKPSFIRCLKAKRGA